MCCSKINRHILPLMTEHGSYKAFEFQPTLSLRSISQLNEVMNIVQPLITWPGALRAGIKMEIKMEIGWRSPRTGSNHQLYSTHIVYVNSVFVPNKPFYCLSSAQNPLCLSYFINSSSWDTDSEEQMRILLLGPRVQAPFVPYTIRGLEDPRVQLASLLLDKILFPVFM